jgi:membrane-associated protein
MSIFDGDNLIYLIKTIGYLGIFGIVFAESGMLLGFFLPGDSLLFTAGFLAFLGYFDIYALIGVIAIASILGDNVGYWIGRKVGPKIFKKEDSWLFHKDNLLVTENFYKEHGSKTIILARFLPFIRTFAPMVAGIGRMDYRQFLFFDILGGVLWTVTFCLLGYFLGRTIPNVENYILPILLAIVLLSIITSFVHLKKRKKKVVLESDEFKI